jgi:pyridoxal phosphate enzyme (YggS family)
MAVDSQLSSRLASVRERIAASGREVQIVAVTKGRPLEDCRAAVALGLTALGENRVQEALPKLAALRDADWHLIGHLQSNKVRQAAGRFALIQSVDSLELAEAIAGRAPNQRILLQVNISREDAKHGCPPEAALDLALRLDDVLPIEGLMGIGPLAGDPEPGFHELTRLHSEAEQALGRRLPVLSMGMSDDYEVALRCGTTMLRLGRALFG